MVAVLCLSLRKIPQWEEVYQKRRRESAGKRRRSEAWINREALRYMVRKFLFNFFTYGKS